jgi:hypothetical protein
MQADVMEVRCPGSLGFTGRSIREARFYRDTSYRIGHSSKARKVSVA